ncbi:predicted protein [Naegleria gruberi]|uniref:Predicted protein n=1 Tax=Naegleria gruberi TaxID=5762 RepID=D2W0L3_NAEGR|nr:uncharacterized protein NAEGRDRAFT_53750 [Naegleria gruberi]EFC37357.1 predicted protein [Naegleria gruberi]|eukprot:XP_002670101.1 predicted protein [Naegleria gruberi strain NEG-M]
MGLPMAKHLLINNHEVYVYNRTSTKAMDLVKEFPSSCHVISSSDEDIQRVLADQSIGIIISMLFDYQNIVDVVFQNLDKLGGSPLSGKVFIQMSTISVEQSARLDELTGRCGGEFIEAPVLGTNTVAIAGKLQVLLGCSKELFERVESLNVLQNFGSLKHVGEKSKAIKMKLSLNFLVASLTGVLANSISLVQSNDLDVNMYADIVRDSALYFKYFDMKLPRLLNHDYSDMNFSVNGIVKDLDCIEKMAEDSKVNTNLISTIKNLYEQAGNRDEQIKGQEDFASVFEIMKKE